MRVLKMTSTAQRAINTGAAIYVGRPSPWGNPFSERKHGRLPCIEMFEQLARSSHPSCELMREWLAPLAGHDLVCWCDPLPCHAHVLIALMEEFGV